MNNKVPRFGRTRRADKAASPSKTTDTIEDAPAARRRQVRRADGRARLVRDDECRRRRLAARPGVRPGKRLRLLDFVERLGLRRREHGARAHADLQARRLRLQDGLPGELHERDVHEPRVFAPGGGDRARAVDVAAARDGRGRRHDAREEVRGRERRRRRLGAPPPPQRLVRLQQHAPRARIARRTQILRRRRTDRRQQAQQKTRTDQSPYGPTSLNFLFHTPPRVEVECTSMTVISITTAPPPLSIVNFRKF